MTFMDIRKRIYKFPELGNKAEFVAIPTISGTGSAIVPGDKATAKIDSNICVECGSCIVACPFVAISFRSEVAKVVNYLKGEDKRVVALVAPSYIGQFGNGVTWEKLVYALKKMGFYDAVMVAAGADKVIEKESKELIERKRGEDILFNS